MTSVEMLTSAQAAAATLERVRVEMCRRVDNPQRGDPWFETLSSMGGAVANVQHAAGMLREIVEGEA